MEGNLTSLRPDYDDEEESDETNWSQSMDVSMGTDDSSHVGTVSETTGTSSSDSSASRTTMDILNQLVRESEPRAWDPILRTGVENEIVLPDEDETESFTLNATELMELFEDSTMDVFNDGDDESPINFNDIHYTPIQSLESSTPGAPEITRTMTTDEMENLIAWGENIRSQINAEVKKEDKKDRRMKKMERTEKFLKSLEEFENSLKNNVIDKPWLDRDVPRPLTEQQFTYMYATILLRRKQNAKDARTRQASRMTNDAHVPVQPYRPIQRSEEVGDVYIDPEFRERLRHSPETQGILNELAVFIDPEFQVDDEDPTTREQRAEFLRVMNLFDEAEFVDDQGAPVAGSPTSMRRPLHPLYVEAPVEDEEGVIRNAPWAPSPSSGRRTPRRSIVNADVQELIERMRHMGLTRMKGSDKIVSGHSGWVDRWKENMKTVN